MPSFILRKLRSRSTSRQRRDNNDIASRRGSSDSGKRTNSSSSSKSSTIKSSPTTMSSKSNQSKSSSSTVTPERRTFLGSKQRPNDRYSMSSGSSPSPPNNYNNKRYGRQISGNSSCDADSMAYSSNASEGSEGVFMTAFDRCPPTFSDDVLDRDIFPTQSADVATGAKNATWEEREEEVEETINQELAVLEDNMSNEWTMFSDPSFENRNNQYSRNVPKNMGAMQRDDDNTRFGGVSNEKTARLISPDRNISSPTFAATAAATVVTPNDDLSAWGLTSTETAKNTIVENGDSSPATKRPSTTTAALEGSDLQDVFGTNFFGGGNGFDDDGFFGNSSDWASPRSSTIDNNNGAVGDDDDDDAADTKNNDPWGQIKNGVSPFEDKKDEDAGSVVFTSMSLPDPITPTTEPTFGHPLKRQQNQLQGKAKNEVVVSFEDYNHEIMQSPSNSSFSTRPNGERNVSSEKSNRPPSTTKSHRRMNSYESQGSRKGHRRINSNGSQGSRRRSKGGGSIGSNSSAVDQILEHYRQKRLAKQNGVKTSSATSSTVSSSNHRSIPSIDSLSSVPSSDLANAAIAAPAAAALSIMHIHKSSSLNDTMTSSLSSSSRHVSSPPVLPTNRSNNGVVDWPDDDGVVNSPAAPPLPNRNVNKPANVDNEADQFLMANIEATIGPCGSAPDIESLNGRSCNRSPRLRNHQASDSQSIESRTSRNSRYSFRSNRSSIKGVNSMSPESKSVANDLFRLEAQLKEVARQQELQNDGPASSHTEVIFVNDKNNSSNDMNNSNGCIGAEPIPRQNPLTIIAPPGKLGILLLNNKIGGVSSKPTHVSAVRSESVLAGKVQVGDQLMKIDGEDVSQCNSKQIMAIMAAKSEYERVLEFRCLQSSNEPQEWI